MSTLLNVDSNQTVANTNSNSFLTDVGVGVVFGLGYYLIKYLYGDSKSSDPKDSKAASVCLDSARNIEELNPLINTFQGKSFNAFEILDKINKLGFTPNITTYNNLLNLAYVNASYETADKLIDEIFFATGPVQPDLTTYNILLKGISYKLSAEKITAEEKQDLIKRAKTLLAEIRTKEKTVKELKPNHVTINTLLDILIKGGELNHAWDLFDSMKTTYNLSPDKYSYSTILKALKYDLDLKKLDKAFGILNYLKANRNLGTQDEIIFNSLIDVCFKLGQIDKAEQVFREMRLLNVEPGKITYALMIKGFGAAHNVDKAIAFYQELKLSAIERPNLAPNEIIYGCVLNACVINRNIRVLNDIYTELRNDPSVKMNIILYTILIKAFGKSKNLTKATELYDEFVKTTPLKEQSIAVYNAMLDSTVEGEDITKMKQIYEQIRENAIEEADNAPQPDLITYSTVIKGYARAKDMDNVFKLYDYLNRRTDFTLDEVVYNSILDGCAKTNSLDRARKVYADMKQLKIKCSNVTYSIMVKLYTNCGLFDQAFEVLLEMKREGVNPGLIVYTCLMQAAVKCGDFERSVNLFEMMKRDGVIPDQVVYNLIVNNCMYNYQWDLAVKYTFESFDREVKLADEIYQLLLQNICSKFCNLRRTQKNEYVTKIMQLLKEKHVQLDDYTYSVTAKFFYKFQARTVKLQQQQENQSYQSIYERDNQNNKYNQYNDHSYYGKSQQKNYYGGYTKAYYNNYNYYY